MDSAAPVDDAGLWFPIGRVEHFDDGRILGAELMGRAVAVWRAGEDWHAVEDACPHRGAKFSTIGRIERDELVCGWHDWRFCAASGEHVSAPSIKLLRYPVRIRDDRVEVDLAAGA